MLPDVGLGALTRLLGRVERAVKTTRQAGFPTMGASAGLACFPADARMYAQKAGRRPAEPRSAGS